MPTQTAKSRIPRSFYFIVCGAALACIRTPAYAQSNFFEGSIAYPVSESGVTFSQFFNGELHTGFSYTHTVVGTFRFGLSTEYSRFRDPALQDVVMTFLTPSLLAVYSTHLSGRHRLEGTLQGGYSWIVYKSKDPAFTASNESGPYVAPGIQIVFKATPGLKTEAGVGYKVVFEHLGNDSLPQDSTIRYFVFGFGIILGI